MACNQKADPLPAPAGPATASLFDRGFPTTGDYPLPLDEAVVTGQPDRVQTLLEAGADPNARWSSHGDRFPLEEAVEGHYQQVTSPEHHAEIVAQLLKHGADPNARWCPFESRGPDYEGCVSESGVTPLIAAVVRDEAAVTYLLLDAGADPTLEDISGANALEHARGEALFLLLQARMFPDASSRDAATLDYLKRRAGMPESKAPWEQTPLARASAGVMWKSLVEPVPPPRARAVRRHGVQHSRSSASASFLGWAGIPTSASPGARSIGRPWRLPSTTVTLVLLKRFSSTEQIRINDGASASTPTLSAEHASRSARFKPASRP